MRPGPLTPSPESLSLDQGSDRRATVSAGLCLHFEHFPDPVLVVSPEERVLFLNRSALSLFGSGLRPDVPTFCHEIMRLPGDDAEKGLVSTCLKSGCIDRVALIVRNAEGKWLPCIASANLIKNWDGSVEGCFVILRDDRLGAPVQPELLHRITRLTGILQNISTAFFTVDSNLMITSMNERLEQLIGVCSSEVINKRHCFQVFSTPFCNGPECTLKQAMGTRSPVSSVRSSIINHDGKTIPVMVDASIITDHKNNVIGGVQALRDISEVVEAEQKIRLLTESTPEGILMAGEDYRIVYANTRMAELCTRSREELLGHDIRELLPPQHVDMMKELMSKADQSHQVRFCSTIQPEIAIPGSFDTLETCMASIRTNKGILTCLYFRDLKAHIGAERELRKANAFLNNIIRSSVNGIVVLDRKGNVLIFNEGAERILGYKAEEVIGHPEVFHQCYKPEIARENMRRMHSSEHGPEGKLFTTRVTLRRKNGETVPVSFSAALIKEGDREIGSVGIFTDLSEQVKIRRELEEARSQLLQAERIASLGRLAAGVAHEINNPLAGILIYADLLMKDIGANPQCEQDLSEIINQTLRCKEIVRRLLEFSRQPLGERTSFDPNQIIDQCLTLLKHQALFHDIKIVCDMQADLPQIIGDPGQIQQVFINLIINAAAAMEGKGTIRISSRVNETSEGVVLSIVDNGPGVPLEVQDKIFEPFFTTKGPQEGTGLGLSVVYGIVQQHGGSITVQNSPEGGAVFTISLPLESPETGDPIDKE